MADREISGKRAAWLHSEAAAWVADGLVSPEAAAAITARYRSDGRTTVVRLVSALGAAFIGVGLISLVAANVDEMSPLTRFLGIAAVWLAAAGAAEWLRSRGVEADGDRPSVAVGAARVVAVAAYGATIFQAAQSLQVPAYSSSLLGCWALGALIYAYACRGVAPLVVGVATGVAWLAWAVGERSGTAAAVVVTLLAAAVVTTSVAGVHDSGPLPQFADPWAYVGALLALAALFVAAIPQVPEDGTELSAARWAVAASVALGAGVAVRAPNQVRREIAATAAILGAGVLLVLWAPGDDAEDALTAAELARAMVATAVYLAAAVWYAVVGAIRDRPRITGLATVGLVVFVTMQSFGVFAPLLSGAALFLALGVVLVGGGLLAERGRRRLVEEVAE